MDGRTRLRRLLIAVPVIVVLAWLLGGIGADGGDAGGADTGGAGGDAPAAVEPADGS